MKTASTMFADVLLELERIEELHASLHPAVSIFGSARTPADSHEFRSAHGLGQALAQKGFTVISGGGPGIMRAAVEGAQSARGRSVGFNIALPFEVPSIDLQDISLTFENFFTRKLAFARCSDAFVVMPGGMGTLDELFDILTLIQTKKMPDKPVVLYGKDFWHGMINWLNVSVAGNGYIKPNETEKMMIFDEESDVINHLIQLFNIK